MAHPPRWAQTLLSLAVRPSDVDPISGDLLEEYWETRHDALGVWRADLWFVWSAVSVFGRVVWPFLVAIAAVRILFFPLPTAWIPSIVPAPGMSGLDALVFIGAGYHGARRNGQVNGGIAAAAVTGLFGFVLFFAYAAVRIPGLVLAPLHKPFIVVIILILLALALSFALAAGLLGAAAGRWLRRIPTHVHDL